MKKTKRQEVIIDLISNNEIETQSQLADMLNKEGFQATQATVSRDIKELRLEKKSNGNKSCYFYPENKVMNQNKYLRVFSDGFVRMDTASNFVVIRTVAGMAMAVAAALDALEIKEILGSIAGDDTIMCATKNEREAENMAARIKKLLKEVQ